MTRRDYYLAYKFLKLRATVGGITPFSALEGCVIEQRNRIIKFLSFNHCVKFI